MYKLREYQEAAVDAGIASLNTDKNGILVLPTGSGKSLVIASIAKRMEGKTIVFQPSKEILEQNKSKMEAFGFFNIGVYSASCNRKDIGEITFATIGSVVNKKHLFEAFNQIIIDEGHTVNAKAGMYSRFIADLGIKVIGLTATPYRLKTYRDMWSGQRMAESRILTRTRPRVFKKIVHITQPSTLFDNGYLCPLDYDCPNGYNSQEIKTNSTGQGFNDNALKRYNKTKHLAEKIVAKVADSQSKHILVFTQFRTETANVLAGLRHKNISCEEVSAETKKRDRESILKYFRGGRIRCIVNVGVLTTGFDFPELDCVILGRPTKSVALYYQMTGRGVRIAPGKTACKLIDLCDNVNRFGKIETFTIYDPTGRGLWRLKSDVGNLTGVDVTTGKNLEKVGKKVRKKNDMQTV